MPVSSTQPSRRLTCHCGQPGVLTLCQFSSLVLYLLEGLSGMGGRPDPADDAADKHEAGEDPRDRLKSRCRREDWHEEAPDPQCDAYNREDEPLRGAAQQRGEQLAAP